MSGLLQGARRVKRSLSSDVVPLQPLVPQIKLPPSSPASCPSDFSKATTELDQTLFSEDALTAVGKWLRANMDEGNHRDPRLVSTEVLGDEVECFVELAHSPDITPPGRPHGDPFFDDYAHYTLFLTIVVSRNSGVAQRWLESPRVIMDIMYGEVQRGYGPDWFQFFEVGQGVRFQQPRALMTAFFAKLALEEENIDRGLSEQMLCWADAVSPITQARQKLKLSGKQPFHVYMGRPRGQRPRRVPYYLRPRDRKTGKFAPGVKSKRRMRSSL